MKKFSYLFIVLFIISAFPTAMFPEAKGRITGKVVDEQTGKGVPGVKIEILKWFARTAGYTETTSEGEFAALSIPPGRYGIKFIPPEPYAWDPVNILKMQSNPPVPTGIQIITVEKGKTTFVYKKLKIGGVLKIRTYNKDTNEPLSLIVIADVFHCMNYGLFNTVKKTDSEGLYRLAGIPEGKVDIELSAPEIWAKHFKDVEIKYNETTTLDVPFDMSGSSQITGTVTCKDTGEPIAKVEVYLGDDNSAEWTNCYTGYNGRFVMNNLYPGNYRLRVTGYEEESRSSKATDYIKRVVHIGEKTTEVNFKVDCKLSYESRGGVWIKK